MRLKFFARVHFPFQTKRVLRSTWIIIVLASLCLSALAGDGISQIDVKETKQLIKQAEKLTRKGNLLEAEKIFRQVIEQEPNNSKAKLGLSYVLLKQRRLADAYTLSFEVAKNEPKNARAFGLVGLTLLNFGNFKDAYTILNRAGGIDNNEPIAWFGMGMLDFYENRIDEGLEKLRTAEYLEPNDADFVFALAQVYARAEKYKEAAEAYNRFLSIAPPSEIDRRARIKGLINFLRYLGNKQELYKVDSSVKQSVVPAQILRDCPIIEVKVNNKDEKLRFVLDTGSGISVISDATAERLKIKPVSKGGMARAVGGDGRFEIVYGFLKTVKIGEMRVINVPVYIRKFHDEGEKVDGYIGLSLISKFLTTVDYGT